MNQNRPVPEETLKDRLEEKPFLEHLEDLRRAIIKALLVFGGAFVLCIPLTVRGFTIGLLKRPLLLALMRAQRDTISGSLLPTLSPAGGFAVAMKVSLGCALVLSFPVLLYLAGDFLLPALTKKERRYFSPALVAGAVLFYAGMALCYFVTMPWALQFFWKFNDVMGIENLWTINEYVKFTTRLLIAFGVVFEMPLVILFLVKIGVVDHGVLRRNRRYAIVIAFVVAAVLTPPDIVTQLIMAVPLVLLYELCVWGARMMEKSVTT